MMTRFKVRDLMINVASDERGYPEGQSENLVPGGGSNCATPSCVGDMCREPSFKTPTHCDKPTCPGPPERRQARRRDELAESPLALLQRQLRQTLSQPGQGG